MIVTAADADFDGSAAEVALTVTAAGLGTEFGRFVEPGVLIVPTVDVAPAIPFTFQITDVFERVLHGRRELPASASRGQLRSSARS